MPERFVPEIYAIDFGTTNSLLSAANAKQRHAPIPLEPTASDPTMVRSLLYFPSSSRCFYGTAALEEYVAQGMQGRLVRSIKKYLPNRGFIGTHIEERPMNLEDLIGAFLRELRARANRYFDADVTRVLLGRPALFSSDPRDDRWAQGRLEQAAHIAGFTEVHFCPEPVAAAREFRAGLSEPKLVLIADLGGGTSDFTVIRLARDSYDPADVLSIGGVPVAGDALDSAIMRRHVARHFGAEVRYRVPMGSNVLRMPPALMEKICTPADATLLREQDARRFLRDVQAWALSEDDKRCIEQLFVFVEDALGFQVFEAIETAKRELSTATATELCFDYPGVSFSEPLDRTRFAHSSARQVDSILAALDATVQDAQVRPEDIDIVCCTGGTAHVKAIGDALAARFGHGKLSRFAHFHSVIRGLTEQAQALC